MAVRRRQRRAVWDMVSGDIAVSQHIDVLRATLLNPHVRFVKHLGNIDRALAGHWRGIGGALAMVFGGHWVGIGGHWRALAGIGGSRRARTHRRSTLHARAYDVRKTPFFICKCASSLTPCVSRCSKNGPRTQFRNSCKILADRKPLYY